MNKLSQITTNDLINFILLDSEFSTARACVLLSECLPRKVCKCEISYTLLNK